jgi:hypothetical protein
MLCTTRPQGRFPEPDFLTHNAGLFPRRLPAYLFAFWLLLTVLVLSRGPVYAEWVLTSGDDETGLKVYVDPSSIRRKGNLAKMWQLYDYRTVQTVAGDSLLSIKRYNEFDCTEERTRMLAYTWFSGNMATGKVVYSTPDEQEWEPVVPRTINRTLWKVACDTQ